MKRLYLILILGVVCCSQIVWGDLTRSTDPRRKDICIFSNGNWFGSEQSHWSCCWASWGCLQCNLGRCSIACENKKCVELNGSSQASLPQEGFTSLKDLAPNANPIMVPTNPPAYTVIQLSIKPEQKFIHD